MFWFFKLKNDNGLKHSIYQAWCKFNINYYCISCYDVAIKKKLIKSNQLENLQQFLKTQAFQKIKEMQLYKNVNICNWGFLTRCKYKRRYKCQINKRPRFFKEKKKSYEKENLIE